MDFLILGPLEVHNDRGVVPLGGSRPRAAVALLILHANEAVSADRLVMAVWGEDAPPKATKSLHVMISRVRKAFGEPEILTTTPAGYRLRVRPGELDADRFAEMVARGGSQLTSGEPERAAIVLREALALWRGPALADLRSEPFAQALIDRLEEQRLDCLEARLEADLAAGRHAAVIGELQQLVRSHATRERLAGTLMVALYRCGRQADALEVYRTTRVRLDADLGLRPSPALRALQQQILEQSPALDLARPGLRGSRRRAPLPAELRTPFRTRFVGRVAERDALRTAVHDAREGTRRLILFGGEPGMGKTRLAADTALFAHEAGFAVAWGASAEHLSAPYSAWRGALSSLVELASDDTIATHAAEHGTAVARLVPAFARRAPDARPAERSDPETERYLLFAAVAALLEAMTEAGPVALVLDDLQWADPQSLALLQTVARATSHMRLLMLVTYRDSDVPADHPLSAVLAQLHAVPNVDRMLLCGLRDDEIAEMMVGLAGHELDASGRLLANEIAAETGGNPFFAGQLLQHLSESGAVAPDDRGRWRLRSSIADLGLPQSVHEVVAHRVDLLGRDAKDVLTVAAVIGRAFDVELLERLVEINESRLLAALDAAEDGGVLKEVGVGGYAFAHALFRHSLYATHSAVRRSRMHARVAQELESLTAGRPGERLGPLAHHWCMTADRSHAAKAVHFAGLAGSRALAQLAPDDAVHWFNLALERVGADDAARCDLLIGLGEAQRQLGDATFRETLLQASMTAERLDDRGRMTRAVLANTLGPFGAPGSPDPQRLRALRAALAAVPADWPQRPRMLAIFGKELYYGGDPSQGIERAAEALERVGHADPHERARVLGFTTSISPIAPLGAHATLVDELGRLADACQDPELRFRAANAAFIYAMHSGDRCRLDRALASMQELANAIGQPTLRWTALWCHSAERGLSADLDSAEALTRRAAALAAEHRLPNAAVITFGQLLSIRTEQGRLDELAESAGAHADANPHLSVLRLSCGFIAAETGRLDEAAAVLEAMAAAEFAFPFDRTRAFNLTRCAEIAIRVGDLRRTADLRERLLAWRDQFATPGGISSRGSVELILARLAAADRDESAAREHLARARAAHEQLCAPLLQARTSLAAAEALLSTDTGEASAILQEVAALARRHGGVAIEREADALLRSTLPFAAAAGVHDGERGLPSTRPAQ